jgi:hypothetical protein
MIIMTIFDGEPVIWHKAFAVASVEGALAPAGLRSEVQEPLV